MRELRERQQQEIDLQVAKQLQLDENTRMIKQNQAAEIDRLMAVIDKRNGKLEKNTELEKETKSHSRYGSHNIDREIINGSKTLENIEEPWLAPPSPPPSSSLSDPAENPEENPGKTPFQMDPKKYHFS